MIKSDSIKYLLAICCMSLALVSLAQKQKKEKKERFPSYFGIVVSPVIPNNFIGKIHTTFKDSTQNMGVDFHNRWGYTFGATARIGITKFLSIETGISQVRRHYTASVSIPDSGLHVSQKLAFINYDIPLNALFYVKLSEKWYMDASLGVSLTHYPSDVQDTVLPKAKKTVVVQGARTNRTYFAINAGIGFEFRTEKAGTFFLGAGAKVPVKPPLFGVAIVKTSGMGNDYFAYKPLSAGYFTLDFKYFIPRIKLNKNKEQPNKSIIE